MLIFSHKFRHRRRCVLMLVSSFVGSLLYAHIKQTPAVLILGLREALLQRVINDRKIVRSKRERETLAVVGGVILDQTRRADEMRERILSLALSRTDSVLRKEGTTAVIDPETISSLTMCRMSTAGRVIHYSTCAAKWCEPLPVTVRIPSAQSIRRSKSKTPPQKNDGTTTLSK